MLVFRFVVLLVICNRYWQTCLDEGVVEVDIGGDSFQSPSQVGDIVDVAVHVHIAAAGHLHRPLQLHTTPHMHQSISLATAKSLRAYFNTARV